MRTQYTVHNFRMDKTNLLNCLKLTRNTYPSLLPTLYLHSSILLLSYLPIYFPPSLFPTLSLLPFYFSSRYFASLLFSLLGPDAFSPNPAFDDTSYSSIFLSHSILPSPFFSPFYSTLPIIDLKSIRPENVRSS